MNSAFFTVALRVHVVLLTLLLAFTAITKAQVPVINSFSPASGMAGTVVTINGNNFDSNAANNVVYFGAAKAKVIAATSTRLTVNAPIGASHQPITVTANGLTAYSQSPFALTFSSPAFSASSLKGKTDITSGANVCGVGIKDLDGDGKPDMVVVNSGGSSISFFKNNSQPGALNFKLEVTKPFDIYAPYLAIDDLDGDGRPDVVLANRASSFISIFKNTSTNNQLNFDDAINFKAGNGPYNLAIADFNADGKPDIAVTNENTSPGVISIFNNTTTPGGVITFSAGQNLNCANKPRGIAVADLDSDGLPDLVVTSLGAGIVCVFKNTSIANNTSFAPRSDYTMPAGSTTESVVIADLDGDLKPDVAAADNARFFVSVLKNSSVPGNISFLARQDFPTGGEPFSIAAGDMDGDGKIDLAVTNQKDNTVSVFINNTSAGIISFDKLDFATGNNPRSANMVDIDGSGKPDLITGNYDLTTVSILLQPYAEDKNQTIQFPPIAAKTACDADFAAGAVSSNATIPLTYASSNPAVATVSNNGIIHVLSAGSTTITASQAGNASFNAAEPKSQTLTVSAAVTPTVEITSSATGPVCSGTSITFTATATNAGDQPTYQWEVNGNDAGTNSAIYASNTFADGDVVSCIVTVTPGLCVTATTALSAPKTVAIMPLASPGPSVSIAPSANNVYQGTDITITATVANAGTVVSYQWQVNGVNVGGSNPTYSSQRFRNGDVVTCTIVSSIPCTAPVPSTPLTLTILPPLTIAPPNTFTPNGDGVNDRWDIAGLLSYPDCSVKIYNRYGLLVFQSNGYATAWDGVFNGKPLPSSTYYYIIRPDAKSKELSGSVTLIR